MKYTLGLKKLPFEPDYNQIIYIEGQHDEVINNLIRRNFHLIRESFAARNYDFCYIPYLKHDLVTGERLHYTSWMQIKDIAPSFSIAFIIAISVYFIKYLSFSYWIILPIQVAVGAIVFFLICELRDIEEYNELKKRYKQEDSQ